MRLLFFCLTSNSYASCRASPAYREDSACGIQPTTATAAIFGAELVVFRVNYIHLNGRQDRLRIPKRRQLVNFRFDP